MSDMESARRLAVELGLDEPEETADLPGGGDPDEGAMLAREFGMGGQTDENVTFSRGIAIITDEILFYKSVGGNAIIEIGKRLIEAKAKLKHGEWLDWLREKVDFSERSATGFMSIARRCENQQTIADLGVSKALVLLALPDSELAEFVEEKHAVNGVEKSASEMTVKELKQAIKERDEARLAAERAKADAQAAEDSRAKMEADMAHLKELHQRAQDAADTKAQELAKAEAELTALRGKPVDVAVEYRTDPAELKAAKEEGLSEARRQGADILNAKEAQLAKKQSEADKLREELKTARAAEKAATLNLQKAEQAAKDARAEAERARRAAEVGKSQDFQAFKLYFDQAQKNVNEMEDLLRKAPPETREKMAKAMEALADIVRKAAGV